MIDQGKMGSTFHICISDDFISMMEQGKMGSIYISDDFISMMG